MNDEDSLGRQVKKSMSTPWIVGIIRPIWAESDLPTFFIERSGLERIKPYSHMRCTSFSVLYSLMLFHAHPPSHTPFLCCVLEIWVDWLLTWIFTQSTHRSPLSQVLIWYIWVSEWVGRPHSLNRGCKIHIWNKTCIHGAHVVCDIETET